MGAEDNLKTVHVIYEAFGRGDVATILESLTDDVDWATEAASTTAPWYGVRRGPAGVTGFFEAFGGAMEVEEFAPRTFTANDTDVQTVVHIRAKSRATGKYMDQDLHHWFSFRDGKVAHYRGAEDTEQTTTVLR